jgi:hypothetical protein
MENLLKLTPHGYMINEKVTNITSLITKKAVN